jgi:hypothetical protein
LLLHPGQINTRPNEYQAERLQRSRTTGTRSSTPTPTPWAGVTLETYEVTRKGFLRMTVTADRLQGEFFTVPLPGEPEDGPAVLRDQFLLDWKTGQLVSDGPFAEDDQTLPGECGSPWRTSSVWCRPRPTG